MSILDILLMIITVIILIQVIVLKKNLHQLLAWLVVDITIITSHAFFDHVRWQVLIMYGVPICTTVYYLLSQIEWKKPRTHALRGFAVLFVTMNVLSVALVFLLPLPELSQPTGPYEVGTTLLNLEDSDRPEIYGSGNRDIRLQIWYPAEVSEEKTYEDWIIDGDAVLPVFAEAYKLPKFSLNHLSTVKSYSYKDVLVNQSENNYPVIIMSHGWSSTRNMHNNFAEDLASHGYIVIGIDHTYASAVTRLHDGTIVQHKSDILPEVDFLDEAFELIQVFSDDIDYVQESLADLNESHRLLKGSMNLHSVGLLGHSTGAGAGVYYAMNHNVQAVFGMDPWVEPIVSIEALNEPYMAFRSEEWDGGPNDINLKQVTPEVYQIESSKHQDFTLAYALTPIFKIMGVGGEDTSDIQLAYMLNFFNAKLKNQSDEIEELNMEHESVKQVIY